MDAVVDFEGSNSGGSQRGRGMGDADTVDVVVGMGILIPCVLSVWGAWPFGP